MSAKRLDVTAAAVVPRANVTLRACAAIVAVDVVAASEPNQTHNYSKLGTCNWHSTIHEEPEPDSSLASRVQPIWTY